MPTTRRPGSLSGANFPEDVGVQAKFTVGRSYYTGMIVWDNKLAGKYYPTDYLTYNIKVSYSVPA